MSKSQQTAGRRYAFSLLSHAHIQTVSARKQKLLSDFHILPHVIRFQLHVLLNVWEMYSLEVRVMVSYDLDRLQLTRFSRITHCFLCLRVLVVSTKTHK